MRRLVLVIDGHRYLLVRLEEELRQIPLDVLPDQRYCSNRDRRLGTRTRGTARRRLDRREAGVLLFRARRAHQSYCEDQDERGERTTHVVSLQDAATAASVRRRFNNRQKRAQIGL